MTPKKLLSALIAASLIIVSPGLPFYAHAADIVGPELGARPTSITPVVPVIPALSLPQNLDLLKGAQGLPINGSPVVPTEALPVINANAAESALSGKALSQAAQDGALPRAAVQATLAAATANTAAVNKALTSQGGETSAKTTSDAAFDASVVRRGETASPVAGSESTSGSDLQSFVPQNGGGSIQPPAPPARGGRDNSGDNNAPRDSKLAGFAKTMLRVAVAGAVVVGLQMGGAALLPALFGLVPEAAVWAVASGALLLPAGVYARYRLSKRDSPRLTKVKWVLDGAIGAFIGAVVVAAPALGLVLAAQGTSLGLSLAVASGGVSALALSTRGSAVNILAGGAALGALPLLVGVGSVGALGIAPIIGMMALPAITTVAFFLGSIINSAETGRPFEVPGSMQKMRFPSFNWVMIGVVFALVTGYSAVYTNLAFAAWMFLGNKQKSANAQPSLRDLLQGPKPMWKKVLGFILDFDHLFVGLAAFAAITGFHTPLTFLVLAFAPERAAVWTERLLGRILPASKPSFSSDRSSVDERDPADKLEAKMPNFHHWLKTGLILAVMASAVGLGAFTLFGVSAMLKSAIPAAILAALPFFLSRKLVKVLMKAQPTTPEKDPEFFDIMNDLRAKINAKRQAAGKKPIPMPEMVNVPMDAPNAFATGPSPFSATVGVTVGIKDMLLDPENVREQLGRLIGAFNAKPNDPKYKIFRRAIVGSVKGISETATPQELAQSLERADPEQLRALGKRMLRGVLAHEFSHVMDRHMLTGSVGGFFSSVFSFASYGIMWGVGHAQVAVKKLKNRLFGASQNSATTDSAADVTRSGSKDQGAKPEMVEPLSTAVALKSLPALLKVLAALWGPVVLQITQMAGSRNNESQADEDGAKLSEDPESLALALGMLMTWRPRQQFFMFRGRKFEAKDLPLMTAIAPMMTVNPLQQMSDAGMLPKLDALSEAVVGKGDNFLFNLFVTHPDTNLRIETLFNISEGLRATQKKPADPGGGITGPPLSFVPPPLEGSAPAKNRGGSFRGAWGKLKGFFSVLPDKDRNRQFWKFVWGQALINVGISFHYSSLGKMADPTGQHPEQITYNRAVNAGAQMVSSLATGPVIDRTSVQKVMQVTYFLRAMLLLAVPLVFFGPHLLWGAAAMMPFLAFQVIIFATGFAQSAGGTAASVAFNRILAQDTARYNKANAVYNVVVGFAGVVAPLLAGVFIASVGSAMGLAAAGNALSYAVYGALMIGTIWLYRTMKVPRDELLQARRDLAEWLKSEHKAGRLLAARSVSAGVEKGEKVLHLEVKGGALAAGETFPSEFQGYAVRVIPARSVFTELSDGFRAIWKSRFLKYYLAFSTVVYMMSDPLVFSVIGGYVKTGLHLSTAAGLAQLPLIGTLIVNFTKTPEALFGLYMSAAALGGMLASFLLIFLRDKDPNSLDRVAARFEAAASQKGLDADQAENAGAAVRDALPEVLAAYRERKEKSSDAEAFGRDVLARALNNFNADVFAGKKTPAELDEFARAAGLADGVAAWAKTKEAGKALKTGLPLLERQGKWTSVLHAAGWLLFWGVLGTHSLAFSVGAMILLSVLQGPAVAVWSSLVTEALRRNHRQEQGKIYGAMNFYALLFGVAGPFLFGTLLKYAALHPAVHVMAISLWVITAMAVLDVWQAWKNFPMETRRRKS